MNGHHLSLHFNVGNGAMVASAPTFFGSNPAEVRVDGPKKGLRVLGDREDTARALLMALDRDTTDVRDPRRRRTRRHRHEDSQSRLIRCRRPDSPHRR